MNPSNFVDASRQSARNLLGVICKCAGISLIALLTACLDDGVTDCTGSDTSLTCAAYNLLTPQTLQLGGTIIGNTGEVTLEEHNSYYTTNAPNRARAFAGVQTFLFNGRYPLQEGVRVTVASVPAGQTCEVLNGTVALRDTSWFGVQVVCHNINEASPPPRPALSSLSVSVDSDLPTPVVIRNERNGDQVTAEYNKATKIVNFPLPLNFGEAYAVVAATDPSRLCTITDGTGVAAGKPVVAHMRCGPAGLRLGGSVTGLSGTLQLSNIDGQKLSVTANGTFQFPQLQAYESRYDVSLAQQPDGQTCSVDGASGTVTADVTTITVVCKPKTQAWQLGGNVSGLSGSLTLSNTDGQSLSISSNGAFAFASALPNGTSYGVSVAQQPSGQICSVSGGSGTITADVSVAVVCQTANVVRQFLYVANNGSSNVSAYSINATTGALTPATGSPIAAGAGPVAAAADPLGRFAFVANQAGGSVSAYAVNAATGGLTPVLGSPFAAINSLNGLTVDPTGKSLYLADGVKGVLAYSIGATGALTPMAGSPFTAGVATAEVTTYAVAVDPSGRFAYVANANFMTNSISAFSIGATGALTPLAGGPTPSGQFPNALVIDAAGKFLYAANYVSNNVSVFAIGSTGTLTPVAGSPFAAGNGPQSITLDRSGKFAYVANNGSTTVSAYSINPTTGALAPLAGSPFTAGSSPASLATDTTGKFLYVANYGSNNISAFAIDGTTGALTAVSGSPFAAGSRPTAVSISSAP